MKEWIITSENQNQRLDKYLLRIFNQAPPSLLYKLLRKKRIRLNNQKAAGNEILKTGDCIRLHLSDETVAGMIREKEYPQGLPPLEVFYEDQNLLICNKPAGLLSHSRSPEDADTLIDRALSYLQATGAWNAGFSLSLGEAAFPVRDFTPALCNRLDRNTSGLVVCGKNLAALQEMNRLIAEKKIDKYYLALVKGQVCSGGRLEGTLSKDRENNKVNLLSSALSADGKTAITEYLPLRSTPDYSLLQVRLVTGRSHQIRAHLHALGHPVVGDPKYGDPLLNLRFRKEYGLKGQLLHGEKIVFGTRESMAYPGPGESPLANLAEKTFSVPPGSLFQKIARGVSLC